MSVRYSRISTAVVLAVGLIAGWSLSLFRPSPLRAAAGDRFGETIMTTGPVLVRFDEATKSPIPLDAAYILDYKGGRLRGVAAHLPPVGCDRRRSSSRSSSATWPPTSRSTSIAEARCPALPHDHGFARPVHSRLGSALCHRDHENQMAVYRLHIQETSGKSGRPKFEMVQLRSYAGSGAANP